MPSSQLATLTQILLPSPCQLSVDDFLLTSTNLELCVSNREPTAHCTTCGTLAERIHSHYERFLADLPCCGRQIRIHWMVRRFFCDDPNCPKITFAEQRPAFAHKYARKTQRLSDRLYRVGLEVGGETGKRLSGVFDITTSGDHLIRLIRSCPEQNPPTPKILGIDDWAWRKRHTYGTILVDLERRCVVDLLPDRQPETIAEWLRKHPGVEIISRDRGQEYIEGIAKGLPGVVQVADRFHLLCNLLEALQRMLEYHPGEIKLASKKVHLAASASSTQPSVLPQVSETAKTHRQVRFEEVKSLQAQGLKRREIARRVGLDRRTVGKYFCLNAPPSRKGMMGRISKATTYNSHLHKRLKEGCRNIKMLFEELQKMGFKGSYSSVFRAVHRLGVGDLKKSVPTPSSPPRFSPKQAAWVLFQMEDRLNEPYFSLRKALCNASPLVARAEELVQSFRKMVITHQAEGLESWLLQAERSSIPEFVRLAVSFRSDYAAVRAGLMSPWSNGQVEGQVNRLKLIKRQMFGRAGFDLLRKRVLGPAPYS
jgi:transposase